MEFTKQDFETDAEVRWCPGCGDYAILAAMQKVLPKLGVAPWNTVFVSGIGCSSRFPYYVNTYGFHTIHGRAPTIATGLKLARPDLSVWVVTGDGDGLSIGANHLMHLFRRNVDLKVLLFNNRIYGLTKGQYSPTSEQHKITKTTPFGSLETPLSPCAIALASGASFVGRAIDVDTEHLQSVLLQAAAHKGTAFVEIFQNCNVFNDGAFENISEKAHRKARTVKALPNHPLVFGEAGEYALSYQEGKFSKTLANNTDWKYSADDMPIALALSALTYPDFPVALGVLYQNMRPTFETLLSTQKAAAAETKGDLSLEAILRGSNSWEI